MLKKKATQMADLFLSYFYLPIYLLTIQARHCLFKKKVLSYVTRTVRFCFFPHYLLSRFFFSNKWLPSHISILIIILDCTDQSEYCIWEKTIHLNVNVFLPHLFFCLNWTAFTNETKMILNLLIWNFLTSLAFHS